MIFAHRLALATGRVDVDAMLHEITVPQMTRWMAYAKIEPFGGRSDWFRHGALMALIANIARDPKKTNTYKPEDFIPE